MRLFKNRLRASSELGVKDWNTLTNENQLQEIIEASDNQPIVIFKHSTTCGISFRAKYGLETDWDFTKEDMKFYYLDLLNYRSVSNKVAQVFGVVHQSPQIIVIKNGKAVFDTSHHAISVPRLRSALEN